MLSRRIRIPAVCGVSALALTACGSSSQNTPAAGSSSTGTPTVGISQLVPATALNQTVQGIEQGLRAHGYVPGKNIKIEVQNAQGNISLTESIAQHLVGQPVNVLVGVATPSAQAAAKAIRGTNVPMVFASVTDPVTAGLISTVSKPSHANITGVYNQEPIAQEVSLMAEIKPSLHRLGVIYDPGESNSVTTVKALATATAARGWKLVRETVASSADVYRAAQSLVGKVDAMYMPEDNTVNAALGSLLKVQRASKIPLFTDDAQSVAAGAIATIGHNNVTLGKQAAGLIVQILKGKTAGNLMPLPAGPNIVYINRAAAASVGLSIPASVSARAVNEAG